MEKKTKDHVVWQGIVGGGTFVEELTSLAVQST